MKAYGITGLEKYNKKSTGLSISKNVILIRLAIVLWYSLL
jgi:hypothetical protein